MSSEGQTSNGGSSAPASRAPPPAYKPASEIICPAEVENCDAIEKEKVKTVLCVYYMHGNRCKYGSHCAFAHGENELRAPPTEMVEKKRELTDLQAKKQAEEEKKMLEEEKKNPPPPYTEKAQNTSNKQKKDSHNRQDDRREPPSYDTFRSGGRGAGRGRGGSRGKW